MLKLCDLKTMFSELVLLISFQFILCFIFVQDFCKYFEICN